MRVSKSVCVRVCVGVCVCACARVCLFVRVPCLPHLQRKPTLPLSPMMAYAGLIDPPADRILNSSNFEWTELKLYKRQTEKLAQHS